MAVGPDLVQVLKQESTALGGDGADDVPYTTAIEPQEDAIEAAGLYLQDAGNRDEGVYVARAGDDLILRDKNNLTPLTLTELVAGAGGLTVGAHENVDSLVHNVAETNYTEITRTSGRVTSIIVWETAAKLKKIRETTITRSSGQVSVVVDKQYDAAGALIVGQTLTKTITRSSGQVASIATVES